MKSMFEIREYNQLYNKFNEYDDFYRVDNFNDAKTLFFNEAKNGIYGKILLVEFQADKAVIWYTFERNYPQ